jgi:O-antigen ligase
MLKRPLLGIGPDHFPLIAEEYGWRAGKEAHSLWLQIGAELGFPGALLLLSFYVLCVWKLWPIARGQVETPDPWARTAACMVIAALLGFMVAAQFITAEGIELPYYVILLGAGVLKLSSRPAVAPVPARTPPVSAPRRPAPRAVAHARTPLAASQRIVP